MNLADLIVKIGLEGASEVKSGLSSVEKGITSAGQAAEHAGRSFIGNLAGGLRNAGQAALYAGGAFGTFAVALAATSLFKDGVEMDSLVRGLNAVNASSADTTAELAKLKEVARLPGLGVSEAVQMATSLQAAGLSADLAERSLMAFGNALATVGKGKEDLDGVGLALTQIQSAGKVTMDNVNQINSRVPQLRAAMVAAFGTADTEQLQKQGIGSTQFIEAIVTQLAKLPQVSGGAGNAMDNLSDKIKATFLPIGSALARIFETAEPAIENILDRLNPLIARIGTVFNQVANSGVLATAFNMAADGAEKLFNILSGGSAADGITGFVARILSAAAMMPTVLGEIASNFQTLGGNIGLVLNVLRADVGEVARYVAEKMSSAAEIVSIAFTTRIQQIQREFAQVRAVIATIVTPIADLITFAAKGEAAMLQPLVTIADMVISLWQKVLPAAVTGGIAFMRGQIMTELTALKMVSPAVGIASWVAGNASKDLDEIKAAEKGALSKFNNVAAPKLQGFGGMKEFAPLSGLFSQSGAFESQINAASSAVPKLADTGSHTTQAMQAIQAQNNTLQRIERNTGKTAEVLSLRRQATGGGELGALGVTPAELAGTGKGRVGIRRDGYGIIQISTAPAANDLDRAIRKIIQHAFREAGGQGFRPKNA